MTIRTGWKLLPGTTTSPSSGPKKVSAKRIRSCPGCAECARKAPLESISFLRAWNKGRPSGSVCRSILPKTQRRVEAKIRELIDRWLKALRTKDLDGIMSCYSPDVLLFDLLDY